MAHPYVGVTGIACIREADEVRIAFHRQGYSTSYRRDTHIPMVGILVSDRTLRGKPENRRYPPLEKIKRMIVHSKPACVALHYYTCNNSALSEQIDELFSELDCDRTVSALQLNVDYPLVKDVQTIKSKHPWTNVILSVTQNAMNKKTFREVAESFEQYRKSVDYLLIDPSGGNGLEFNINHSVGIYYELRKVMSDRTSYGFAGGFKADNVARRVRQLAARLNTFQFSIDVESGVRSPVTPRFGDDKLATYEVRNYLRNVYNFLP